jgi:predicted GNAT family acetyltransferase
MEVVFTEEARSALEWAGAFLSSRPIDHNLIHTLLVERAEQPLPGRYWMVTSSDTVVGLVFQSPAERVAVVTRMDQVMVHAVVDSVARTGFGLPGVQGDATTAALFAGAWTETTGGAAEPVQGQRLYRLGRLTPPRAEVGRLRHATNADRNLVHRWSQAFAREMGGPVSFDVDRRLAAGRTFLWGESEPVSMAAHSEPVDGVSRIQAVYTPSRFRRRGFATACVAHLSQRLQIVGLTCILFADLNDPTSNAVYRTIGYESVAEHLGYRFSIRSRSLTPGGSPRA